MCSKNILLIIWNFVEDVNSWMRGTHEFHKNRATTNPNDSTVFVYRIGWRMKGMTPMFYEHTNTQKGNTKWKYKKKWMNLLYVSKDVCSCNQTAAIYIN